MTALYVVIALGATLWLVLVFQALVGLRMVRFSGRTHAKVHRWIAYGLIAVGLLHGLLALNLFVLGWF